jgi:hypothetical protein
MTATGKFFTPGQMTAIQKIGLKGMTTPVEIFRRIVGDESDPYGSDVTYDEVTPIGGCLGWLHSTPTPMQQIDNGMLVTFNTYRLYVPVETNILPGDRVVLNGTAEYNVSDTTNDETWPALLACSLRLKE